ncbi:ABC transporter ATP-binding protein [Paenibacillus sp. FSL K6-2524]|uniref:ABC transporter ATP-binding protein n=1 Tax=Paenibacillus sp. FSL K6-2524 TaxID=2954516 RepID=UPI0030F75F9D
MKFIEVENLKKDYYVREKKEGLINNIVSIVKNEKAIIKAIDGVSFKIDRGEMVGYIGPNGAGKSTTIKVLTGIIHPTSGNVQVGGVVPYISRKINAQRIGVVFGQRSQLLWDLPLQDSFELQRYIYNVSFNDYSERMEIFRGLFELDEFIKRPVRQLSLGQRMRGEICMALVHNPDIVYFDEPTIGLDIIAKERIRFLIKEMNNKYNTTFILTTHDMFDIEEICNRVIVIDQGRVLFDNTIQKLLRLFGNNKVITIELAESASPLNLEINNLHIISTEKNKVTYLFEELNGHFQETIHDIFETLPVRDISIQSENIENVVKNIYSQNISTK